MSKRQMPTPRQAEQNAVPKRLPQVGGSFLRTADGGLERQNMEQFDLSLDTTVRAVETSR